MKNNMVIIIVIITVLAGAGGFFAGVKYQQSQGRGQSFRQQFNGQGSAGMSGQTQGRARMGARQVVGEILSQDDKSITVKLPDGSTKIVLLSSTTTINKAAEGSKSDLKIGEKVGVFGTDNSDGSVTAQNVQLNPAFRVMGGTGGGSPK